MKKFFIFSVIYFFLGAAYSQNSLDVNDDSKVDKLLELAEWKMGCNYIIGATGPQTFDCSGFTQYLYKQVSVEIPRTAREQYYYKKGKIVPTQNVRKGDLIFFIQDTDEETKIGHVAMAITDFSDGDFQFIHSCSSKGVCKNRYSDSFYNKIYVGARRIIRGEKKQVVVEKVDTVSIADDLSEFEFGEEEDSLWLQSVPEFPVDENPYFYYIVKGKEPLIYVSRKYSVSTDNLVKWNALKSENLIKGQRLKIYYSIF